MTGSRVRHSTHGLGTVVGATAELLFVQFDGAGLQSVLAGDVQRLRTLADAVDAPTWDPPLPTLLRAMAHAIRSANDRWGVFTSSRVKLLPHQLWVAHRVLAGFPGRYLIADDVGLGKTIEAGLILAPLLSRGLVRRLLVICPASLVEQWQDRLRTMFDIRSATYAPEVDRPSADFWDVHSQVIVSLHTLRLDSKGRWTRLVEAEPWDLVVVDEAHHLGLGDGGERTLALQLMQMLDAAGRIASLLLFTGTPHRGKDVAFLGLLELLDRERFSALKPLEQQLAGLRDVMIRNNKQSVTDMAGQPLFKPVTVSDRTYAYTEPEAAFYDSMSSFIETGLAYAGPAKLHSQRKNMLVLVTLQKLAASSVAAVKRALAGRLEVLEQMDDPDKGSRAKLDRVWQEFERLHGEEGPDAEDRRHRLEEQIDRLMDRVMLSPDEIPRLRALIELADAVGAETRIRQVRQLVESLPAGTTALLFTEYKATQALVVSELAQTFGRSSVSFINGDGFLDGVCAAAGVPERWSSDRLVVADRFNRGDLRFLVSTEAAGEGIDLQGNCHTLVHVDMPWNPMRMHQRVGRLNRFGQKHAVRVHILRNPSTVESRVWELLNRKLERICTVHGQVMADPEDVKELVLGVATGPEFERLMARAHIERPSRLEDWFETESATFGGESALRVVERVMGQAARFDFGRDVAGLPQIDLPALGPFLRAALRWRGKTVQDSPDGTIGFPTPQEWSARRFGIRSRYDRVHFDRDRPRPRPDPKGGRNEEHLLGAGHRLLEAALDDAIAEEHVVTVVDGLADWVVIHQVRDAVSGPDGSSRRIVFCSEWGPDGWRPLRDWEVVAALGPLLERPERRGRRTENPDAPEGAGERVRSAIESFAAWLPNLDLGMKRPATDVLAVLAPGSPAAK